MTPCFDSLQFAKNHFKIEFVLTFAYVTDMLLMANGQLKSLSARSFFNVFPAGDSVTFAAVNWLHSYPNCHLFAETRLCIAALQFACQRGRPHHIAAASWWLRKSCQIFPVFDVVKLWRHTGGFTFVPVLYQSSSSMRRIQPSVAATFLMQTQPSNIQFFEQNVLSATA